MVTDQAINRHPAAMMCVKKGTEGLNFNSFGKLRVKLRVILDCFIVCILF